MFPGNLNQIFRGFIDFKNMFSNAEALKIRQTLVLGVKHLTNVYVMYAMMYVVCHVCHDVYGVCGEDRQVGLCEDKSFCRFKSTLYSSSHSSLSSAVFKIRTVRRRLVGSSYA